MTLIKPDSFYCLITHSDLKLPNEEFIKGKLACIKEYAGVDCPRENVVIFMKKPETIKEFVQKIKTCRFSGMQVNVA